MKDLKTLFSRYFPDKNLEIGKTSVLELKHLCHLLTPMSLNDINLNEALQILNVIHPTAALGIYPRVSALYNVFKGLELQKIRRNFGAPFGFINKKSVFIVAAIRNFYFSNAELILFSGCGITQDSQFQDEVSELQKKRNSVKLMMGLNL